MFVIFYTNLLSSLDFSAVSYIWVLLVRVIRNYTQFHLSTVFHNCWMHSNHAQMALVHVTFFYLVFMNAKKTSKALNNCCVSISHFFFFKQGIFCILYCPVLIWALCLTCWQSWYFFSPPYSHWCDSVGLMCVLSIEVPT